MLSEVIQLLRFFTFLKAPGDDLSDRKLSERTKQHLARFPRSDMLCFRAVKPYCCSKRPLNDDRISYRVLQKLEFSGHDALQMRHQGNVTYRKTGGQNVRCRMRDRMKLKSGTSCASKARRLRGATFGSSLVQVLNGREREHCRNAVIEEVTVPNKEMREIETTTPSPTDASNIRSIENLRKQPA